MRLDRRVGSVLCLLILAGCAKPVAPVVDPSGATPQSTALGARARGAPHPFSVRLKIVGSIVTLDRALQPVVHRDQVFYVTSLAPGQTHVDTVPAFSELRQIQWRRVVTEHASRSVDSEGPGGSADPSALAGWTVRDSVQVLTPGFHEFQLEAPPRAGGGTVTVRLFAGFAPSTWWAGPDPDRWPGSSDGDGRAVDVTDWSHFTTVPAWPPDGQGYFGPDSFRTIPSQRRPPGGDFSRRTFYEIHGNRIYARSEGDTVHLNSWIAICNGGYDKDSRYRPLVDPSDPALPPGFAGRPDLYAVLLPQGLVGSPIGFRSQLSARLTSGEVIRWSSTGTYPDFEPMSVFRLPQVAGYWRAPYPGKYYLVARARDADGLSDFSFGDAVAIADLVDAGGGTAADRLLRRGILTFHVRGPVLSARE